MKESFFQNPQPHNSQDQPKQLSHPDLSPEVNKHINSLIQQLAPLQEQLKQAKEANNIQQQLALANKIKVIFQLILASKERQEITTEENLNQSSEEYNYEEDIESRSEIARERI